MNKLRIKYHMETGLIKSERLTHLIEYPEFQIEGNDESGVSIDIDLSEVQAYISWLEEQLENKV
jgi:hypothetical protein